MKKGLRIKKRYMFLALFIVFGLGVNKGENRIDGGAAVGGILTELMTKQVSDFVMPISQSGGRRMAESITKEKQNFLFKEFPVMVQAVPATGTEIQEYDAEPQQQDKTEDIFAGMLAENETDRMTEEVRESAVLKPQDMETAEIHENITSVDAGGFRKGAKTNSYDFEALSEYQTFVSTFYTIDAGTTAGSNELNLEKLMAKDMVISKEDPGPQILIYHTHSLEAFADSVPGERAHTIVGIGDRLADILTREYGYEVLHHTEEYDTVRGDAYANSLPGLKKVLEENPSIQVVIDLHRDAGVDGVKRSITLDGKPTATFMLFNGLSRTRKTGNIDYLYNPYLEDNLAFSFQMQVKAGEYYPGLTRKIYLKAYRYNMHLVPKTLLIELGDSNNTVEEVTNTCYPLAHILDMVLSGNG